jgi:undecaprenyl phosphate N,N'-diacetylbacillosamine 1-phosphate transferase
VISRNRWRLPVNSRQGVVMSLRKNYCREHGLTGPPRRSLYRLFGKRLFDLVVCLPIFLVALPVFILTAILIRLDSRGPVLFVQKRLGRYGSTFRTWKLRTMTHRERSAHTEILPGHSEVTRIGRLLRRAKLDELPQLLNILKGDMSLVGPRPALPGHIRDYDENGLRRLLERPGLTGLAQVNGNIYLSWPERWIYDAEYAESLSVWLDATIVVKTVAVVFLGEERFLNRPETSEPEPTGKTESSENEPASQPRRAA